MHTKRVNDSLQAHEGNDSRYSSYGMGFVKFAAEEKQLFRWLYLDGEQLGPYRREFRALTAIYGKPTKLPDFAVKAGVVL